MSEMCVHVNDTDIITKVSESETLQSIGLNTIHKLICKLRFVTEFRSIRSVMLKFNH